MKIGDKTAKESDALIINGLGKNARYAIAEHGRIIWVGTQPEFAALIRKAARDDQPLITRA